MMYTTLIWLLYVNLKVSVTIILLLPVVKLLALNLPKIPIKSKSLIKLICFYKKIFDLHNINIIPTNILIILLIN